MPIGTHVRNLPGSGSVADDWSGVAAAVGVDSSNDLQYNSNGTKRVVPKTLVVSMPIIATFASQHVFIADDAYQVTGIRSVFSTASTSGTIQPRKATGTQTHTTGAVLTTAVVALSGTADTSVTATLSSTAADLLLAAGDRIAFQVGGTMTNLVGGLITIFLRRVSNT